MLGNKESETPDFLSQLFEFTKYDYFELFPWKSHFMNAHYSSRFQQSISHHEISSNEYIKVLHF